MAWVPLREGECNNPMRRCKRGADDAAGDIGTGTSFDRTAPGQYARSIGAVPGPRAATALASMTEDEHSADHESSHRDHGGFLREPPSVQHKPPHGRVPVKELTRGQVVEQPFAVARVQFRQTRSGNSHYIAGTVSDRTGQIDFRIWDANRGMLNAFVPGHLMTLKATVEEFNDTLQLNVNGFAPTPKEAVNPRDFYQTTRFDPHLLFNELKRLLGDMVNPFLSQLRDRLFEDVQSFVRPFYYAPAATRYHHAWRHGLLEHTVSALQLASRVCDHYPRLDRDIVLMGVFLHDAGKAQELTAGPDFDYTLEGSLVGHITLGVAMVDRKIATIPGFPRDLEATLLHCIVAHHGELEHGSPKEPMTPEALAVHHIECLDAHLSGMWQDQDELARMTPPNGLPGVAYSKRFRRSVLVPSPLRELPAGPPHLPRDASAPPARTTAQRVESHDDHAHRASEEHDAAGNDDGAQRLFEHDTPGGASHDAPIAEAPNPPSPPGA